MALNLLDFLKASESKIYHDQKLWFIFNRICSVWGGVSNYDDSPRRLTACAGGAHDIINFHLNPVLRSWTAIQNHSVQSGANVVISQDANNTLTINNVQKTALATSDFTFA